MDKVEWNYHPFLLSYRGHPRHVSSGVCLASASLTRWNYGASWRSPAASRAQSRITTPMTEKFDQPYTTMASKHTYKAILTTLSKSDGGEYGKFYSLPALNDRRIDRLPVKILLESAIRNCDNYQITKDDVDKIIDWEITSAKQVVVQFKPTRVILENFSGVPALVDLASMRDAMKNLGSDPNKINPGVPVDLVFDHPVQVYGARPEKDIRKGMQLESDTNWERVMFLKWSSSAFYNMQIVSPESGIVHQANLEYLGRVVFSSDGILYPDSVVGTDTQTTVCGGLGVIGWEAGGIDAEAAMLGQPINMVLPGVVGLKLVGKLQDGVTSSDLVPIIIKMLRKHGVVGNFVEFYGEGVRELSLDYRADIASIPTANGAIMGFFPVDHVTLEYLKLKGRSDETVAMIESYLRANKMFVDYDEPQHERAYTTNLQLDLGDVEPCIFGPKRDRISLKDMKAGWKACFGNPLGWKEKQDKIATFSVKGQPAELKHGSVVIAHITRGYTVSCCIDMVMAALVAKKAYDLGLEVKPWVRPSIAPLYGFFKEYLLQIGLQEYFNKQGFHIIGRGFTTGIYGSDDLSHPVATAISENVTETVAVSVLSRGIIFESLGRPAVRAHYIASPPLVVVYALAGTVDIDFRKEPMGTGKDGKSVYLRDIWPSREEITQVLQNSVLQSMFKSTYETIKDGNPVWNEQSVPCSKLFSWDPNSTYFQEPPFFKDMTLNPPGPREVKDAYCLLNFGDNINTWYISPAGNIHRDSPAANFLTECGTCISDFNSYGSRRGNHEVMTRGTFADIRIVNKLLNGEVGPKTIHIPTGDNLNVFDAATLYKKAGQDTIILAGAEYGCGNSRDWATKGPMLLGVKAIIARSFGCVHRSNLASMGIVPLCFKADDDAETLGLTGYERYTIHLPTKIRDIKPGQDIAVTTDTGKSFVCTLRLDTEVELAYYDHNGMLPYVIRSLSNE